MDQADRANKLRNSFKLRLSGFQRCAHHLTTNSFYDNVLFLPCMSSYTRGKSTEYYSCFVNTVAVFQIFESCHPILHTMIRTSVSLKGCSGLQ